MKRIAGKDGRRKRATKSKRDERKLALRERPDFSLYLLGAAEADREYGAEVDRAIDAALVGGTGEFCAIHGLPLEETHPADAESGPSPEDTENRLVCWECEFELGAAAERSECLAHRVPIGYCAPCLYADLKEV